MEDVKYSKLEDVEKAEKVAHVYPPPPPMYEDAELLHPEPPKPARTHLLASILATVLCCFPAGLLGLIFSMKTCCANKMGDSERARKFSRYAKKFIIIAVVLGTVILAASVAIHIACFARKLQLAKHSFRTGLMNGIGDGKVDGAHFALAHLNEGENRRLTLPDQLPMKVNIFDVRSDNPFWVEVKQAFREHRAHEATTPFGYQFGWAHGFKVGFCGVKGTDCTGVELDADSRCPFRAIFGKWRWHGKHHHFGKHHRKHHDVHPHMDGQDAIQDD